MASWQMFPCTLGQVRVPAELAPLAGLQSHQTESQWRHLSALGTSPIEALRPRTMQRHLQHSTSSEQSRALSFSRFPLQRGRRDAFYPWRSILRHN